MVLELSGARVTAFGSAREALDLLTDDTGPRPDILISDLSMPGEGGISLIRKLREWERTHGGALPAVALTGVLSLFLKFHTIGERELISKGLPGSNPENMCPFWNQA